MDGTWVRQAVEFFAALEEHNDRSWWQSNRGTYDDEVKPGLLALLEGVTTFGPWRVYRPHNDTRFASGRPPYKSFIGAVAERVDGIGAFVQIGAGGLLVGTGVPMPAPDQLRVLRGAIADPATGETFLDAVALVRAAGATVSGGRWDPLRRPPRGYPQDHPRADYLRWKGIEITHRPGVPAWLGLPAAYDELDERFRA